ncbi:MAG: type II toxin-antitoxin system RelE/ParE family toxin [Chloroflexota bacterium]
MPAVIVAPTAQADLERLIQSHSLPRSTRERLRRSIDPLRDFPLLGAELHGRWAQFRFILGPWRWMIVVYYYDPDADLVAVATIQDGRSAAAVAAAR